VRYVQPVDALDIPATAITFEAELVDSPTTDVGDVPGQGGDRYLRIRITTSTIGAPQTSEGLVRLAAAHEAVQAGPALEVSAATLTLQPYYPGGQALGLSRIDSVTFTCNID
jgi:hypothetical protein